MTFFSPLNEKLVQRLYFPFFRSILCLHHCWAVNSHDWILITLGSYGDFCAVLDYECVV